MAYTFFTVDNIDGVGVVTINNPPANAISKDFVKELNQLIVELSGNGEIKCVLFRSGIKKYFSVGADLASLFPHETLMLLADPPQDKDLFTIMKKAIETVSEIAMDVFGEFNETLNMIEGMMKPTIAAINGHALGGGLEFTIACDYRLMGRDSGKIGLPEVKLGLIPLGGGTQRLPRLIGKSKAIELLLDGTKMSADEAFSVGLVTKVYNTNQLDEEALAYAKKLSKGATLAMGLIKNAVNKGFDKELLDGLKIERDSFYDLAKSDDIVEGIISFLQKREPDFRGK